MVARRKKTPMTQAEKADARDRRAMRKLEQLLEPLRLAGIERQKQLKAPWSASTRIGRTHRQVVGLRAGALGRALRAASRRRFHIGASRQRPPGAKLARSRWCPGRCPAPVARCSRRLPRFTRCGVRL
jgi:hypothetical protein